MLIYKVLKYLKVFFLKIEIDLHNRSLLMLAKTQIILKEVFIDTKYFTAFL